MCRTMPVPLRRGQQDGSGLHRMAADNLMTPFFLLHKDVVHPMKDRHGGGSVFDEYGHLVCKMKNDLHTIQKWIQNVVMILFFANFATIVELKTSNLNFEVKKSNIPILIVNLKSCSRHLLGILL